MMLNGNVQPSTLEGIKRLATQIKKKQGVKHSQALNLAAKAARFENYTHAKRTLSVRARGYVGRHRLFLTIYWSDRDTYEIGRETLEIALSMPFLDICEKSALKRVRGFGRSRLVADDHIVWDMLHQSQESARSAICTTERSLRFMEFTGLIPSNEYRAAYPDRTHDSRLPGTDHATNWVDPSCGQFILIDEPYRGVPKEEERIAWANRYGWHLRQSSWPGMYYPNRCSLYAATDAGNGYDFDRLMETINSMPSPLTTENWSGESVPSHEVFVSPAAKTPQDCRRAKSKGTVTPRATRKTIPYNAMFSGVNRRPASPMPVSEHVEVGRIIKAVLCSTEKPFSVNRRMDMLRSTLEDWLALEIGRSEMQGPEFFDVYYHEPDEDSVYAMAATSSAGLIGILDELKSRLRAAYPDCAPLRDLIGKIDTSISITKRQAASSRR